MSNKVPMYEDFDAYFATFDERERLELAYAEAALDLALLLQIVRKARGLTQRAAAARSGLQQQAISRWERSHPNVQLDSLQRYLAALGYELDLVIRDIETGRVINASTLLTPGDKGEDAPLQDAQEPKVPELTPSSASGETPVKPDHGRVWHASPPRTPSDATRIMIVDDHPLLRRGLTALLLSVPGLEIVGQVGSGEEAVDLYEQVCPDIVLMDLLMPGMGGVEAIRAIRRVDPEAKIMVISNYEDGDQVKEALQAGAMGYQLKGGEIDELVDAIRQAVSGIPTLARAAAASLVRITIKGPRLGDDLTDRERELLELLAKGLSNTAIAERMVVTVATVKFHLRSVRTKLGTKTRTETVALAIQHHLIPTPHDLT
jgi:two-component system, NarL family, response regulator LiaR